MAKWSESKSCRIYSSGRIIKTNLWGSNRNSEGSLTMNFSGTGQETRIREWFMKGRLASTLIIPELTACGVSRLYFAKNANYSDDYRFNCANGDRQFFLAEVLIGDTID